MDEQVESPLEHETNRNIGAKGADREDEKISERKKDKVMKR